MSGVWGCAADGSFTASNAKGEGGGGRSGDSRDVQELGSSSLP